MLARPPNLALRSLGTTAPCHSADLFVLVNRFLRPPSNIWHLQSLARPDLILPRVYPVFHRVGGGKLSGKGGDDNPPAYSHCQHHDLG